MKIQNLTTRVTLGYLVLVLLAGILALVSTTMISRSIQDIETKTEHNRTFVALAQKLDITRQERYQAERLFFITGKQKHLSEAQRQSRIFFNIATKLKDGADRSTIEGLGNIKTVARKATPDLIKLQGDPGPADEKSRIVSETRLETVIHEFIEEQEKKSNELSSDNLAKIRWTVYSSLFFSAIFLIIAGVFSFSFSTGFRGPLDKLLDATQKITRGQLDHRVSTSRRDEIGVLTEAFDEMSEALFKKDLVISKQIEELSANKRTLELYSRELEMVNKEMEGFIYSISHDLKSPLVAIQGFSRILDEEHADGLSEKALYYLSRIEANGQKMEIFIHKLLQLARAGHEDHDFANISAETLIHEVLDEMKAQIESTGAEVTTEGEWPTFRVDSVQFKQAITNLLDNALQYRRTEVSPVIRVGVVDSEDTWGFYVKDNGIGIGPDYHEKVFEVFERLVESHDKNENGTGMGLAIVKKVAEKHGGNVKLESEVDKGSTFYFEISKRLEKKEPVLATPSA